MRTNYFYYRAMLCIRGTSHGPVSVCPSQGRSQGWAWGAEAPPNVILAPQMSFSP